LIIQKRSHRLTDKEIAETLSVDHLFRFSEDMSSPRNGEWRGACPQTSAERTSTAMPETSRMTTHRGPVAVHLQSSTEPFRLHKPILAKICKMGTQSVVE
jgi:hypothetical protein